MALCLLFARHSTFIWLFAFMSIRCVLGASSLPLSAELLSIAKVLASKARTEDVSSVIQTIKEQSHQIDILSVSVSRVRGAARASIACDISKLVFSAKYVDASSSSYIAEVQEPWSETCWLPSACILNVNSTADTAIALKIVTLVGSKFAIRSGGHNPNAGFASVDDSGVLINLGNMNALSIAADHKSVSVGPGAHWGDVYAYLDPYGISAIGGRNPPIGVGGLLLGGGMPYIPSMYGLACDNVKSFEVVLANSTVVEANASSNSDLFFALKGGGPNYGIVTRVDLHTVPLHQVWYKFNVYNISDYQAVLAATVQTQNAMESDNKAGFVFNANRGVILVGFIYGQWSQEPVVFKAFDSIKSIGTFAPEANGTILSMSAILDIGSDSSAKREPVAVSHLVDLDLYQELFSQYLQLANYSSDPATDMSFAIQAISAATVAAGVAKGGNPLGLVANKQTWFNSLVDWTRAADDAAAHTAVQKMRSTVKSCAQAKGKLLEYEFMNDASYSQNPLASYGAVNLAKLKAVSRRYDPRQIFQTLQNSGFLLSKA